MTRDLPFDGDEDDAGERTGDTAYQVANGVARVARAGAYVTGGALVAANGGGVPAPPGSAKLDSWNAGWARASDPDPDAPSPVATFPDPDPNNLPPLPNAPVNQGVQAPAPGFGTHPPKDLPTWRDGIPGNNQPVHPNLEINPNFRDGVPGNNQTPPGWNDGIPGNNAPVHPKMGGQHDVPSHQPPSGQFGIPGYEPPRVPDWREGLPGFGQRGANENGEGQPGFGLPGHGGNGFGLPGTEGLVPPGSNPFVIPRIPAAGKTESVADQDESAGSSGNPYDLVDHNPFYATGNPFDGVGTPFQGANHYDGHAFDGVGGGDFGAFVGVEAGASLVTDFDVEFGITPEGMYFYTDLKVEASAGIKVVTAAGNNVGDQVDKFNDWLESGGKLPGARNNGLDHGNGGSGALGGSHASPGSQLGTGIAPQPAPLPAPVAPPPPAPAPAPVVAAPVVPVVAPAVAAPAPALAQPVVSTPLQTTIQPDAATTPIAHTFDAPVGASPLTAPAAAVPALFEQPTKHTVVVPPDTGHHSGETSTGTPTTIPTTVTTSIPTHTAGPTMPDATKTPDGVTKVPGATVTPTIPDVTITKVPGATPSTGGATQTGTPSTSNGGATNGGSTQTGTPSTGEVTLPGSTAGGASSTPSMPTTHPSADLPTVDVPTVEPTVDVPTVEPTVSVPVVTPSVSHSAPALTTMPTVPTFDTDPTIPTMDIEVPTLDNDIPLPTQPMPTVPVKPIAAQTSGDHGLVYYPDAAQVIPGTEHTALLAGGLSAGLQPEAALAETHHPVSTGHDLSLMM